MLKTQLYYHINKVHFKMCYTYTILYEHNILSYHLNGKKLIS